MKTVHSFNELLDRTAGDLVVFNFDTKKHKTPDSSNVKSYQFSNDGLLFIQFKSGAVYQYDCGEDSEFLFNGLRDAPSKGKFVHVVLRKNPDKYPYKRIKERYKDRKGIWKWLHL